MWVCVGGGAQPAALVEPHADLLFGKQGVHHLDAGAGAAARVDMSGCSQSKSPASSGAFKK